MPAPPVRPALAAATLVAALALAAPASAAVQGNPAARGSQTLIGADDDNTANAVIQAPGVVANQSLRNGDLQLGGLGDDVLIGRTGPDVQLAGEGDDVIVGGTEAGSDVAAFPPSDVAQGHDGDDLFAWAPGDGSDAFVGGEPPRRVTRFVRRTVRLANGRRVRVYRRISRRAPKDTDRLVLGTMPLQPGDNFRPELFPSRWEALPRVFVSDRGLPTTIGTNPPRAPVVGFCEIVPAPAGSNADFLVRFFVEATGNQAVTIRITDVEEVLCGTRGAPGITLTSLGARGNGPPRVVSQDFQPLANSRLDAIVD